VKVLIADDDPASLLLLQAQLRRMGHEVTATRDGQQAWAALEQERFPVFISDCVMPELGGLDLCRRIRATWTAPYRYVILLTAHSGREEYLHGIEAGADDFLTKPFDPEDLAARLKVAERILGLERDVAQLSGLLSICSCCRRIRDVGDDWVALEAYVARHTEADLAHGICPECLKTRARPEIERFKASREAK
jgi:DNA-binding response OmpR family regulator